MAFDDRQNAEEKMSQQDPFLDIKVVTIVSI
jgi:hypothetical protein